MAKYGNTSVPNNSGPADDYFVVTKSDTVDFATRATSLYVGTAGDVVAVKDDGSTVLFKAVPAGGLLPIACKRVHSTGTTAADIVGLA